MIFVFVLSASRLLIIKEINKRFKKGDDEKDKKKLIKTGKVCKGHRIKLSTYKTFYSIHIII